MGNKSWQQLAAKAREIARRIINGDEEDYKGERLTYIVDRLDVFATDALNKKYANNGSVGSIHTYAGGTQVISTRHTDGSEGSFNTDGECRPTDNPMDIEGEQYTCLHKIIHKSLKSRLKKPGIIPLNVVAKQ